MRLLALRIAGPGHLLERLPETKGAGLTRHVMLQTLSGPKGVVSVLEMGAVGEPWRQDWAERSMTVDGLASNYFSTYSSRSKTWSSLSSRFVMRSCCIGSQWST